MPRQPSVIRTDTCEINAFDIYTGVLLNYELYSKNKFEAPNPDP